MPDLDRAAALSEEGDTIAQYRTRLEENGFETNLAERASMMRSKRGATEMRVAYVQVLTARRGRGLLVLVGVWARRGNRGTGTPTTRAPRDDGPGPTHPVTHPSGPGGPGPDDDGEDGVEGVPQPRPVGEVCRPPRRLAAPEDGAVEAVGELVAALLEAGDFVDDALDVLRDGLGEGGWSMECSREKAATA